MNMYNVYNVYIYIYIIGMNIPESFPEARSPTEERNPP